MSLDQIVQYCLSGITVGSIYIIVAIGFNIIYNTTGIINFAQGEFVILGALLAVSLNHFFSLPISIILAVIMTILIGAFTEFVFFRWIKKPTVLRMIIITIGLSILFRELMLHFWGDSVYSLPFFSGSGTTSINILGAGVSPQVFWVLAISSLIVIGLSLFFRFTLTGKAMRACAANQDSAKLCGINVRWMVTLSFMLSAGIGALAGCVISPLTQTQYDMGSSLAIKGFTVAILAGLGNSLAAVVAGLFLGILESFSISVLPLAYKDAISILVLLIILFVKPGGLFGSKQLTTLKDY